MNAYDPEISPDPSEWLALDEQDRIDLAEAFHKNAGAVLPDLHAHAAFHCAVETQLAERYQPAWDALNRLKREGLSRHDCIHAVSSVLAAHLFEIMQPGYREDVDARNARLARELDQLTVKRWKKRYRASR